MKKVYIIFILWSAGIATNKLMSQSLDFKNTVYYTAVGNVLISTGQTLTGFNYDTEPITHPIFTEGIFFPVQDFQGNNIWVKVTHIAADPNGTSVGVNVAATCGDPFRAGFGGWAGFLYQFEIYKDGMLTGTRSNTLDGFFTTNISVESIETLSAGEWLSFELINTESTYWALNSINFTGSNPGSNPGFSSISIPWPGSQPPSGFSTTFPVNSKFMCVVDYGGSSYAEFKMSAENVSRFNYGYEYTGLCGGYQGMNLSFGAQVIPRVEIAVSQGTNPGIAGSLLEFKATPVNAGANPTYQWKRNGEDVAGNNTDTYSRSDFKEGEIITCVLTIDINNSVTSNSITIEFNGTLGIKHVSSKEQLFPICPNPVKRGETLHLNLQNNTANKIEIINTLGQVVYSSNAKITGSTNISISSSAVPGQYILRLISENKVITQKLVIH